MSVSISSACWALQLPATEKLVLLCLADFADDDGLCWPSVETMVERTGLSDRCVREQLKRLEAAGLIERDRRVGQSAMCRLSVSRQEQAGAEPRQEMPVQPAPAAASTGTSCRSNRHDVPLQPARRAGANRSTIDPPLIHQRTKSAVALPDWVEPSAWQAFVECRKAQRAPFTPRAAELILAKLEQLMADGQNPNACLLQSVERGWRGVFPLKKEVSHGADRHRPQPQSLLDRVRAACDEQQARFEALAANGRAVRPQVDLEHGPEPERVVVEGRFRVV